jgi:Protein of unknown function (DUF2398)
MSYFEHLAGARVQAVLNCLVESTFFYREDDAELFQFLRRHRAEFARFFAETFGWELIVDARSARLYKERWHNPALRPGQRDAFNLTRRDDCLAFLLVLEFYQGLTEQQNLAADDALSPRFAFGELFAFARDRMREELRDGAPDDDQVRRLLRGLWPALERYRFVREVAATADERGEIDDDHVLYEALPALNHYDLRLLAPGTLDRVLGAADADPEA